MTSAPGHRLQLAAVMRAALRVLRMLTARLELEHLRWARREIDPMHRDLPTLVRRIAHLEERCRA